MSFDIKNLNLTAFEPIHPRTSFYLINIKDSGVYFTNRFAEDIGYKPKSISVFVDKEKGIFAIQPYAVSYREKNAGAYSITSGAYWNSSRFSKDNPSFMGKYYKYITKTENGLMIFSKDDRGTYEAL